MGGESHSSLLYSTTGVKVEKRSRREAMTERVLFVDLENVQKINLARVPADARVMIFYGVTQKKIQGIGFNGPAGNDHPCGR
jgi:hypothetical protein